MGQAIVLFSHGSRDPLWRAPVEAVAARIRTSHPGRSVACAYLEGCAPSLAQAAARLVARGATRLTVVPMFLGSGRHAREDLPRLVAQLRCAHPGVQFHVQAAIGEDPRMTALMADIACE
ncbi:sirohydrochlorin chelatase [Verminephrobacter aporrectodeae]|uniref:Cobalamin biosynthesis protein CbiX n=1 Tax=Verminephrobacter aporrectodeae subsp. tuberculatae TaxID=1110392 RepID=A0ABT3KYS4_9BURK|nr:CbiX/SirB N-terminal domain-containing protein [Verminephrobacter aporrectodeae]MCW5219707.1 cobalamin biosynthesis protein CbiX [Verminephrobacter aporrectodeae subsp. tuberculatae]MCW5258592.1 cobalamin biosynthesis protein CbiX [Verminephrobacter aporrectodeae subsp. tuberculatae]MCW5287595.1 cobalamin biosynthesis protein CbiX [Verminephrobacter aporrectodeae subsp. tuberculatae]MCW5323470.1 cobalamin biosynthesis protein CbiX [Verminephrobacter aporrectodeae subsp. tuberculatae]MCW8164